MKKNEYMVSELIDVTNKKECVLLSIFTIMGLVLFWVIWKDYKSTQKIYIKR